MKAFKFVLFNFRRRRERLGRLGRHQLFSEGNAAIVGGVNHRRHSHALEDAYSEKQSRPRQLLFVEMNVGVLTGASMDGTEPLVVLVVVIWNDIISKRQVALECPIGF